MPTRLPPRTMIDTPSSTSSPPSVTMNDGILSRATSVPWIEPTPEQMSSVTMIASHHGHVETVGLHELGDEDGSEPHDQPDREVDLAEEQGEDLGHRQEHVDRALLEEVDQVLRRQELAVGDLEGDRDNDDAEQDGQDAAVTIADALQPGAQILAQGLSEELRGDVGFGRATLGRGQVDGGLIRRGLSRGGDARSRSLSQPLAQTPPSAAAGT